MSGKRKFVALSVGAGLLLSGATVATATWAVRRPYRAYPGGEHFVEIRRGDSAYQVAERLRQHGVVSSARLFYSYLAATRQAGHIKAGEYRFSGAVSMREIAAKLYRGDIFLHKITIPEGLVFEDVKRIFLQEGFGSDREFNTSFTDVSLIHDLDPQAQNLEGYLFPETYLLSRGTPAQNILKQMVRNFRRGFDAPRQKRTAQMGLTVRQVVILASLIEKESAVDAERFLISSVYSNRLKRGMLLECDPTVIYAARLVQKWDGVLHRSDLELDSPYNTYRHPGLPPGPIASPGIKSLDAALRPAETRYLYFVSRNDGRHVFNESFRAHTRAVARYQRGGTGS
ncbi:MAG: endolytic transglycosylase MltG [Acidobacteria bacterium]|nr:endolytic transglycosylase MltG [Acidobacteriota bacterium]